jgi:L-aminopeptidase/D-esterase-like protein
MTQTIPLEAIKQIRIGHAQNRDAATGCTVIIAEEGATVGVDVRGGAPGTRETDLLAPENLVDQVHAVLLAGGSAFGLDAAGGVMQYLEEKGIGFDVLVTKVPIVCGAVLFDLYVGDPTVRPDKEMGYRACRDAETNNARQGCVGAGTGASVGKILGMERAMKSGLGAYALQMDDLKIGAVVAVNCLGDVVDPDTGKRLAGLLSEDGRTIADTEAVMIRSFADRKNLFAGNTTIAVVVTNATLTKAQAKKVASMAHDGYARTMRPAHTMVDGDTIFAMATGGVDADISVVGLLAARVVAQAVVRAVTESESAYGLACHTDIIKDSSHESN